MEVLNTPALFQAALLDKSKIILVLVFSDSKTLSQSSREAMRTLLTTLHQSDPLLTTHVRLTEWDCSTDAMAAARSSLDVTSPIEVVAIRSGEVVDRLRGEDAIKRTMHPMMQRILSFVQSKVSRVVDDSHAAAGSSAKVAVDITKLLTMGQDLMRKAQAMYAEKFFLKALGVLDAVQSEAGTDDDVIASTALCLAWTLLAQLAQAKEVSHNVHAKRLQNNESYRPYREEALSDVCRALTAWNLMRMAPLAWDPATCSVTKLTATLQSNPQRHNERAQFVITYFLMGDLERCLTEALKLHVLQQDFGRYALTELQQFLGKDHPLNHMLGFNAQEQAYNRP